jgi:hypothetical protein
MSDILRIRAREALEGDEVIVGPQGHALDGAPTIVTVGRDGDVITAILRDDRSDSTALWTPDSPLIVLRRSQP